MYTEPLTQVPLSVSEISLISPLFNHISEKVFKKEAKVQQEGLIRFYMLYDGDGE
jgi:hypothetical protein